MRHHIYVAEKLRQLEMERQHMVRRSIDPRRVRSKPVFGPVFRITGRVLCRLGAGLESWASPPQGTDSEHRVETEGEPG